jgi:hypothetical protein
MVVVVMYSRRNVREDGRSSTQSDIGELSKTRQSLDDQKFGRRLSEAPHSTPVLSSKRTQMWVVLFFSWWQLRWDIRTSMDLWLRWKLTLKSTSSILKIQTRVFGASAWIKDLLQVLFRQRMQQMLRQGLLLIRFLRLSSVSWSHLSDLSPLRSNCTASKWLRLHDRHLTEDEGLRRTYMDVILDDNHTVCDSIGVISSDPYAFDEGM